MDHEPLPDSGLDRVRLLEAILISAATSGGSPTDNQTYTELRTAFVQDHALKGLLPSFIRTCRDLSHFRAHTQDVDPRWAPRRKYIRDALTPMFDYFEAENRLRVDAVTTAVLQKFDAEEISAIWQKALDRRHTDPEGAITAARTLLETVCKHILDEGGLGYEGDDLPALYSKTASLLNIAPSQHTEQAFKCILGGATSVVEALGQQDWRRPRAGEATGEAISSSRAACREHGRRDGDFFDRNMGRSKPRPLATRLVVAHQNARLRRNARTRFSWAPGGSHGTLRNRRLGT